jgi:putative endonuclease
LKKTIGHFHFVYMLRCSDGTLYTGYTNNPRRRVALHNKGKASKFTRSRLPIELVYLERVGSKSDALKREIAIKELRRREKLKLVQKRKYSRQKSAG